MGPGARGQAELGRVVLGILSTSGCADLRPLAVAPATWVQTQPQLPFLGIPGAPMICKANKPCAQLPLFGHTDAPRRAPCRQAPHFCRLTQAVSAVDPPDSSCTLLALAARSLQSTRQMKTHGSMPEK